MKKIYNCIGIMTGNSLDAVDAVLTEFKDNKIRDLSWISNPIPKEMADNFRELKNKLSNNGGNIEALKDNTFLKLHNNYITLVAKTIHELIKISPISVEEIDIIGFHGQTCYHRPPSISKDKNPCTIQIGSGQMLADLTGLPVAFDFRSDDIFNGGEGAPLAPLHNEHLAVSLGFPVIFCNGGNTGNISVISKNQKKELKTLGWDCGAFNHYTDYLMQKETSLSFDKDGKIGSQGTINLNLLRTLFNKSCITEKGENFITKLPPKSSDPAWYRIIPKLTDNTISLSDRVRTCEFFAAYQMAYSLSFIPQELEKISHFLLFGGGWKNPIVRQDFEDLIKGNAPILAEHSKIFSKIKINSPKIKWADEYGFSGQYMEARIFADMAKCCLSGETFTTPLTTGCKTPTNCGIITLPGFNNPQLWSRAADTKKAG